MRERDGKNSNVLKDRLKTKQRKRRKNTNKQNKKGDTQRDKGRSSKWMVVWRVEGYSGLTGNGAEVEVVSDDLLVVVVHGALGEAQVEVVPQILVNDPP